MTRAWLMVAMLAAGCGDNGAGCIPGEQVACTCAGGTAGAAACAADGTHLGACAGCPNGDAGVDAPLLCLSQSDCPVGYDCGLATASDIAPSCYPVTYDHGSGGYGTSCALSSLGCTDAPDPCAAGFQCVAAHACDPDAYCTSACTTDRDCPVTMHCAGSAGSALCAPRELCDPCIVDDDCGPSSRCAFDDAANHVCAPRCGSDGDCPQPEGNGSAATTRPFETCIVDGESDNATVCLPADGFCSGTSAIIGVPPDSVCAWCRPDEPADCGSGSCAVLASGERFCTEACSITTSPGSDGPIVTSDTCPNGTFCVVEPDTFTGFCAGDPAREAFTCYP